MWRRERLKLPGQHENEHIYFVRFYLCVIHVDVSTILLHATAADSGLMYYTTFPSIPFGMGEERKRETRALQYLCMYSFEWSWSYMDADKHSTARGIYNNNNNNIAQETRVRLRREGKKTDSFLYKSRHTRASSVRLCEGHIPAYAAIRPSVHVWNCSDNDGGGGNGDGDVNFILIYYAGTKEYQMKGR